MDQGSSWARPASSGWERIRELAMEALDRTPGDRASFVESACGQDEALRSEVRRLLESFEAAEREGFLEGPVGAAPRVSDALPGPAEVGALVGSRLGRYRVRRLIGVGGMGAVYEAVQEQPRRTVALKVMRVGLSSRLALRRFEY